MKLYNAIASGIAAVALTISLAVPSFAAPWVPGHPRVNEVNGRRTNQRSRINQGLRSGQLTGRETRHLDRQEHNIHTEERDMRREDGGHLTTADQRALNQQQNHVSHEIYRDKHNDRTQP